MTSTTAIPTTPPRLPDSIRGIILDIDGVLFVSDEALPGAVETIAKLREARFPHVFLTNMTRPRNQVLERLHDVGLEVDPAHLLTAPSATVHYLQTRFAEQPCMLLASDALREDFDAITLTTDPREAKVVVIGGPYEDSVNDWFSYARLNEAFEALQNGAALVAMQRGRSWRTARGLALDAGAFVAGLEQSANVKATVCGKPSKVFFSAALEQLGLPPSQVAMVGDDVDNDIKGAEQAGLTAILVRTGKFTPVDGERARGVPFYLVDSIADVPAMLGIK